MEAMQQRLPFARNVLGFVVATMLVVGAGCENPVPLNPSYERDIKPLMEAHCTRCHGAGGSLNTDPDIPLVSGVQKPNATDFTSLQGENGHLGLLTYTGPGFVILESSVNTLPMPPPPSAPLTDYERDLLFTWAKNPLP
jgi:hypothetical protein